MPSKSQISKGQGFSSQRPPGQELATLVAGFIHLFISKWDWFVTSVADPYSLNPEPGFVVNPDPAV
jgi:hypothetical protein